MAVQDFFTSPRDMASLRQRNAELEGEVAELQAQVIQLQQEVGETASPGSACRFHSCAARKHLSQPRL